MPFEFLPLTFLACNQQYPAFISRNYTSILFSLQKISAMKFEFRSHNAVSIDSLSPPLSNSPSHLHSLQGFLSRPTSGGDTFSDPPPWPHWSHLLQIEIDKLSLMKKLFRGGRRKKSQTKSGVWISASLRACLVCIFCCAIPPWSTYMLHCLINGCIIRTTFFLEMYTCSGFKKNAPQSEKENLGKESESSRFSPLLDCRALSALKPANKRMRGIVMGSSPLLESTSRTRVWRCRVRTESLGIQIQKFFFKSGFTTQ